MIGHDMRLLDESPSEISAAAIRGAGGRKFHG
jgi:hypothetical protein